MLAEQRRHGADGGACALHQRIAVLGVAQGGLQHVAQAHGAPVAQDHHVGLEGAGDAGGQEARARHDVEAETVAVVGDGGACRRRALAADHLGRRAAGLADHDRHVAAGPAQMRLHDLQREGNGDPGIEGVAAALQDAHADRRADPVGGGHHAEGAVELGPGGERSGIDVGHGGSVGVGYSHVGSGGLRGVGVRLLTTKSGICNDARGQGSDPGGTVGCRSAGWQRRGSCASRMIGSAVAHGTFRGVCLHNPARALARLRSGRTRQELQFPALRGACAGDPPAQPQGPSE